MIIDKGKRSKMLNEKKAIKNLNKNTQSFL